ncbi:MAG: hypothetical protein M3342_18535 [Bacteroidota bacterium]|nr:hypothetical protein [Bacteroidota bacterium]
MRGLWLFIIFTFLLAYSVSSQTIKYMGSLCQGGTLTLSVDGAPAGATYQWTKDGTNISFATQPTYTLNTPGTYVVTITTSGVPNQLTPVEITTKPNSVASFTFSPSGQCPSTPVQFTNTSTGASTYSWSFGDPNSGSSNSSTEVNPVHRFIGTAGNGTQIISVKLTAASSDGCSNTLTSNISMKQSPGTGLNGSFPKTYNGTQFFTQCNAATPNFSFTNNSSTRSTNNSYEIQ